MFVVQGLIPLPWEKRVCRLHRQAIGVPPLRVTVLSLKPGGRLDLQTLLPSCIPVVCASMVHDCIVTGNSLARAEDFHFLIKGEIF